MSNSDKGKPCEDCTAHSGHEARIMSNETNKKDVWKAIDAMRNWVVGGMAALILAALAFVLDIVSKRF